jgi:hypothetical protein
MTYRAVDGFLRCREADTADSPGRRGLNTAKRRREEDRRRFGLVIGSEGGGSPIDGRMKFRGAPSARPGEPDPGPRPSRSAELKRGEVDDDQRSQCNEQGPERVHRSIPRDTAGCRLTTIRPRAADRHRPKVGTRLRRMTYLFMVRRRQRVAAGPSGTSVSRNTGPRPRPSDGVP